MSEESVLFVTNVRAWLIEPTTLETVELDGEILNEWLDHDPVEVEVVSARISITPEP